jgi:hypothetical protein
MRHNLLADYMASVERAVTALSDIYVEQYREEWLTPMRGNLRIRILKSAPHPKS